MVSNVSSTAQGYPRRVLGTESDTVRDSQIQTTRDSEKQSQTQRRRVSDRYRESDTDNESQ